MRQTCFSLLKVRRCNSGRASAKEGVRVDHHKDWATPGISEYRLLHGCQNAYRRCKQNGRNQPTVFSSKTTGNKCSSCLFALTSH